MLANFIRETTATTGTGTLTLTAAPGYLRFADGFANAALAYYAIQDGQNRESGIGTVGAGNTLARTTIFEKLEGGVYTANPGTGINVSGAGTLVMCDAIYQTLGNPRKGADIASAATTNIWSKDGDFVDVTGTTTITSLGTALRAGQTKLVRFQGILTLTHGANLIIPAAANATTAAGDVMMVIALTTTQHVVAFYQRASGQNIINALLLSGGTMTGAIAMGNNNITGIKVAGFNGEYDNGNSGSGITIDFANGALQLVTLNAATPVITLANGPSAGRYRLKVKQDGTGTRAPSWAGTNYSASRWLNGTAAPAINLTANGETFVFFDWDGSKWYQSLAKVGTT